MGRKEKPERGCAVAAALHATRFQAPMRMGVRQ
jgi:hypothetical protein